MVFGSYNGELAMGGLLQTFSVHFVISKLQAIESLMASQFFKDAALLLASVVVHMSMLQMDFFNPHYLALKVLQTEWSFPSGVAQMSMSHFDLPLMQPDIATQGKNFVPSAVAQTSDGHNDKSVAFLAP